MLLYILFIVLLGLIIYLLFVPITLFIDTSKNEYFIKITGLAKVNIEADNIEIIRVHLSVLLFNFDFYPLQKRVNTNKNNTKQKVKKRKRINISTLKRSYRILKSFKVKIFKADIDTGDCILNAKLFPIFALTNFYSGNHINVNFEGRNRVLLLIKNRPIHIIKSFINS